MKYCPACNKDIQKDTHEVHLKCPECGYIIYPTAYRIMKNIVDGKGATDDVEEN